MHFRLPTSAVLWAGLLATAATAQVQRPDLAQATERVTRQTNEFRAAHRAGATTADPALTEAAQAFADHMARTDRYSHEADGRRPSERASAHGYDYCLVSENIAFVQSSAGFETQELAERLVRGWKESPGHRKNMLDVAVTETGVAIAQSPRTKRYYAVQMFGRPREETIEFRIANRSPTLLRYELGERSYELPPRVTHTHQQCRPLTLTIRLPGHAEPIALRPAHGERYLVEPQGTHGYRLNKG
ncbi:CAP domain-containing protein [Piscinibacter sp.]|uniref:CAP domain-containing protein n=1 Tax=Piscinibacter sp. TaxID=1903157 RepID=UPI002B7303E3|nr:CAP domain-containing protein [Albitalea sp.]HUG23018.1 CAP domain-containing protein [Albitalea sp.]